MVVAAAVPMPRRIITGLCPQRAILGRGEGDAMHVFTHSFDYIALGILIGCMLLAAAKAIPRHPRNRSN